MGAYHFLMSVPETRLTTRSSVAKRHLMILTDLMRTLCVDLDNDLNKVFIDKTENEPYDKTAGFGSSESLF